jgi:predicted histidine transporter YuiF (NhaC family)
MPPINLNTIIKLLVWSLVVGAVLAFLNIDPLDLFGWVTGSLRGILDNLHYYTNRALTYVLLGAVIVIPIWVISYLWRALKGRS